MTARDVLLAKKRMMFIKGEDYNFLAYNILLLIYELGCSLPSKPFKDHRKLSFLIDFISQPELASIVARGQRLGGQLSKRDTKSLASAYADGESRKHFIERVLYSLASNGKIRLTKEENLQCASVSLIKGTIPDSFFADDVFDVERENIARIRSISPQIRTCGLGAFLERFFRNQGVQVWHS